VVRERRDAGHLGRIELARIFVAVADQHFQLLLGFLDQFVGRAQALGGSIGILLRQVDQCFKCG